MQFRIDGKLLNLQRLEPKTLTTHTTILELQYADDNALVTNKNDALGLTLNARKTHVLFEPYPGNTHEQLETNALALFIISRLGSCLSSKADLDTETQVRLKSASAFGKLRDRVFDNRNIYNNTNIKVYKAIILQTLLYGSEAWTKS